MTTMRKAQYSTVEDEWLASYCGGGLSAAKRLVLDCQAAINPQMTRRLKTFETLGGVLLESSQGERLSENFMDGLFSKIDAPHKTALNAATSGAVNVRGHVDGWAPSPLLELLKKINQPLKWKHMGFGVSRMPIFKDGGEKLYLLKAKPGMKMPKHTHHGEEWALILQGGYHVEDQGYIRGDVHREDENCTHTPIIDDDGEDCITLVASEGGLKFSNPVLGLLKPVLGL